MYIVEITGGQIFGERQQKNRANVRQLEGRDRHALQVDEIP
jgi:hypothetical protein